MEMVCLTVSNPSVKGCSFLQILLAIGPLMEALFAVASNALFNTAGFTLPLFLLQKLPSLVCTAMYSAGYGQQVKPSSYFSSAHLFKIKHAIVNN